MAVRNALLPGTSKDVTDQVPRATFTLNLDKGKRLARRAVELIEKGVAGYTLITAKKEGSVTLEGL